MDFATIASIAAKSGGILYIMPILLLIVLWVSIERFLFLSRMSRLGEKMASTLEQLPDIKEQSLRPLADSAEFPFRALLQIPIRFPNIKDSAQLSEILQEAVMRQVPLLDKRLWLLDTTVTLAPLLGLLGTIIGMFHAFQILNNVANNPTAITGSVAEALMATAAGLVIAIIGLVSFNGLQNQMRFVVHQMETLRSMLINRMSGLDHSHALNATETQPVIYAAKEA
jgi:biopolymer transport protein ExbB